ncbi:hypothetical protein DFJ74DRAFT_712991 [Hyaloraphidium curvatum]|nr:hypothetical protein DFJ74DRAFT_712991 [Hyaloraphidium curvatum]
MFPPPESLEQMEDAAFNAAPKRSWDGTALPRSRKVEDYAEDELLALFPFPPANPRSPDPAAAARAADPLDGPKLLAGLSDGLLRAVTAPEVWWPVPRSVEWGAGALQFLCMAVLYPTAGVLLNDGYFETPQLAAGIVAMTVGSLYETSRLTSLTVAFRRIEKKDRSLDPYSIGWNSLGIMVRRQRLIAAREDGGPRSPLVEHRDEDGPLCTCPLPRCSGSIPRAAAWTRLFVTPAYSLVFFFLAVIMDNWTLLVTWAPRIWAHWWSTMLMALLLAGGAFLNFVAALFYQNYIGPQNYSNEVLRRMRRRALADALESLLARAAAAIKLAAEGVLPSDLDPAEEEGYVWLHARFAEAWNSAAHTSWYSTFVVPLAICSFCAAVVNMIAGSCITGLAFSTALIAVLISAVALNNAASVNRRLFDAKALYLSSRQKLRFLAARCIPTRPSDPRWSVAEYLRAHDAALSGCIAEAEAGGARLLGFAVGEGTVRAVIVTTVTLAVGLWSVLRGLGIRATLDFACPAVQ